MRRPETAPSLYRRSVPEMNLSLRLQGTRLAVGDRTGQEDDAPISAKSLPPRLRYSTGGFGEDVGARQPQFRITRLESVKQRGSKLRPGGNPRPDLAPLPEPFAISLPASSRAPPLRKVDPTAPPCTPIRPRGVTPPPPPPPTTSLPLRPTHIVQPEVALLRGGSPGPWESEEAVCDQTLLQHVVDRANQEACGNEVPPDVEAEPIRVVVKVTKRPSNKRCTSKR